MGISEELTQRLKAAMRAKDKIALAAVRSLKSAIMVEERRGELHSLTEAEKQKLVRRLVKQRQESATIFAEKGRNEAAEVERAELKVLETFLPQGLSGDEIAKLAADAVAESGASSLRELGLAMRLAKEKAAGRADGKTLADAVKALLQGS